MGSAVLWTAVVLGGLAALVLLNRPLAAAARLAARSLAGLGGIWLFNLAGGLIGVQVGVNLISALTVGLLGLPGFGLLLLLQCV